MECPPLSPFVDNIFRQHAALLYGFVRYIRMSVCMLRYVSPEKFQNTSKHFRRLRFGTLGVMAGGRQPSLELDLQWKATCGEKVTSKQVFQKAVLTRCHVRKMNFGGRRPLLEDDLRWKTPFVERRTLVEDDLHWKMTCGGRQPLVENDLPWKQAFQEAVLTRCYGRSKMNFGGRLPLL